MKAYPTILLIVFSALIFGTNLCAVSVQVTGVYSGGTMNDFLSLGDEVTITLEAKESGVPYSDFDYNSATPSIEARSNQGSMWSNITSNFLVSPMIDIDYNQHGHYVYNNLFLNDQSSYFELELNAFSDSTGLTLDFGGTHTPEIVNRLEILIRNDELGNGWNSVPATSITHSDFLSHNYSSYSPSIISQSEGSIIFQTNSRNTSYIFDITNLSIVPEPSTYALILGGLALGFVALRRR